MNHRMRNHPRRRTGLWALALLATIATSAIAVTSSQRPAQAIPCGERCPEEDPDYEEPEAPLQLLKPHRPGFRNARVVALGDSYAAGQGAVQATLGSGQTRWLDDECHRSNKSAIERALVYLTSSNPYHEGIDLTNVTCSGAGILDGLLWPQAGKHKDAQVDQVNAYAGSERIDALVIGASGNDMGFPDITGNCVADPNCTDGGNLAAFQQSMATMADRWNQLIGAIQGGNSYPRRLNAKVTDVYLTTYPADMLTAPDPNHLGDMRYCSPFIHYNVAADPLGLGITEGESAWLTETVLVQLNQAIYDAVARANASRPPGGPVWHAIQAPSFRGHGHCAYGSNEDRWINLFHDSWDMQQDKWGTAHPNQTGYERIAVEILKALRPLNRVYRSGPLGDYTGDGRIDLGIYRPALDTTTRAMWWTDWNGGVIEHGQRDDIPLHGDFDGDHRDDVAVYRPAVGVGNATWWIRGRSPVEWGLAGDVPVSGDFDGDGRTDIAVYRPAREHGQASTWWIWGRPDNPVASWGGFEGGMPDMPVVGDYNGDHRSDIAVFRPSTAQWWVKDQGVVQYGQFGDVPVPADYNGDGRTDRAVYRTDTDALGTSLWYVEGRPATAWGVWGDVPLTGDMIGDAGADLVVWRPAEEDRRSDAEWYVWGLGYAPVRGRIGDQPI